MWKWSGNAEFDALSNTWRYGNDVEEEEQRILDDDAKRENVIEQGHQ